MCQRLPLASLAHTCCCPCCSLPLALLLQPGEDPFTLLRQEKRDRQKKQNKQQLANVKQALKTGGAAAVPATLRLAATLPDKGKGKPTKRRELRDEVRLAHPLRQHRNDMASTAVATPFPLSPSFCQKQLLRGRDLEIVCWEEV
eukprot:GHRQ01025848.1.p2 GENE.GHRQ01025848.1~~GHRQ01025848.1.p2  ORF type:complete len:144 (+),score=43.50 GHRQ01025848.1:702-1133(+)